MRVETVHDLVARLEWLFGKIGLPLDRAQMSDMSDHGVTFMVPGKTRAVMERLQAETGSEGWDYEPGNGFYRNEAENWLVGMRSAPGAVVCMATVQSLHLAYLDRFRGPSPAERAEAMARDRVKAEQGDPQAQYDVGRYYSDDGDTAEALVWYRKAAEQGLAEAQISLGHILSGWEAGIERDLAGAAFWYLKAAEQGNVSGQVLLGRMYEDGVGVAQDYAQAELWYRRAADQGNPNDARYLRSLRRKVKRLERETLARDFADSAGS